MAQLNRASDYGSEGYRFESCRGHKKEVLESYLIPRTFFMLKILDEMDDFVKSRL